MPQAVPMGDQLLQGMHGLLGSEEGMSVLLIFPPDDALLRRFAKAADGLGLPCDVLATQAPAAELTAVATAAVEKLVTGRHHLVLLDRRDPGSLAADGLLRALKSALAAEVTGQQMLGASTFAAVAKSGSSKESLLSDLLQLGYDLKIREELCTSVEGCTEELLAIQRNTFRHEQRLGSLAAVLTALGNCNDAVEITDEKLTIQYVNAAHERMFGFALGEIAGRSSLEAIRPSEKVDDDARGLGLCLKRGKAWDGMLTGRRKSGALLDHYGAVYPVRDWRGAVHHYVWLRRPLNGQTIMPPQPVQSQQQQQQQQQFLLTHAAAIAASVTVSSGGRGQLPGSGLTTPSRQPASRRGSAVARAAVAAAAGSAAVDSPINKVISLISQVQDGSSPAVSAALDKVLEILHQSTDLYTGELATAQEDRMTSDYVGGLMSSGSRLPDKKRQSLSSQRRQRPSEVMREHINQLLESTAGYMETLKDTPDHLQPYLEGDAEWTYDILELERVTSKKPLVHLAMRVFRRFGLCQFLRCSEDTMLRWLQVIQDHYRSDNCYHNATHGADVMQSSAYFLERDRIKAAFDEMDEAASLLGALVHDLDHPGRTNPFLINSQHRLALLYNDTSVLESHHVSLAFQLTTKDERINIFKNMSRDDFKTLRQNMIDVVLATEMAKHFEHIGKFANQILAPLLAMEEGDEEGGLVGQPISEEEAQELLTRPENRTLIKRVLIKCSDVSNPCRPLKLCREWASRISEEYFQQTDEEKSKGLPIVMPVFDRVSCNMPKSQVSFIDFFLKEMFTAWNKFCHVPVLMENLSANYAYWKRLVDEQEQQQPQPQQLVAAKMQA